MPKSSRHKSHKQSKHREHSDSDSEEDLKKLSKQRNGREETAVRVSRDLASGSGEKRKSSALYSQSREGKDLYSHENGNDFVVSKRRKDKGEVAVGDRWNGGGDERSVVFDKEVKGESSRVDSEKSKHVNESKSKSSRSDMNEKKGDYASLVMEKEASKSSKNESRRKTEKDKSDKERPEKESSRKEASQPKDSKEKDRGLDRDTLVPERNKRELEVRGVDSEAKRKQGSYVSLVGDEHKVKRGTEHPERSVQEELQNDEFGKEVEKHSRRKGDLSWEKDKYKDDKRVSDDRHVSSRYKDERYTAGSYKDERNTDGSYKDARYKDGRHTDGSYKDVKNTDESYRERYKDDMDRESRRRDGRQKEDIENEKRHRVEKYKDEHASRDRPTEKYDSKHRRNETDLAESRDKKPRSEANHFDDSSIYDDRSSRYKDDKERRSDYKEGTSDLRARRVKEQSYLDKKSGSGSKPEPVTERERPRSRHADIDAPVNHNRRMSSPNSCSLVAKDHYRYPKDEESKYRDVVHEERDKNYVSSRDVNGGSMVHQNVTRSMDKFNVKDEAHMGGGLSTDRRSDTRNLPLQSPSGSTDRRPPLNNRSSVRRNIDVEESGPRRGAPRELKDFSTHENKSNQDLTVDSYSLNEHSQADGENNTSSSSSPFIRTSYPSGNLKSFRPPLPSYRSGVDSLSGFNSYEDGKPNNRFKRVGDPNMGRGMQGNSWNGVPNWPSPSPSPISNGFIPFQHGLPPVGFHHPMMQQPFSVPPPMFGGAGRPPMEINHPGLPFHYPDTDRFSSHGRPFGSYPPAPLQGWDPSNGHIGDGSHMYGRPEWDHSNRNTLSSGSWETGVDMWKGQNLGMITNSLSVPKIENTFTTEDKVLAEYEKFQHELQQERADINPLGENSTQGSLETQKKLPAKTLEISKKSKEDNDAHFTRYYLSKLDISADLISPELNNKCVCLMLGEKDSVVAEDEEGVTEAKVMISSNDSNVSLFAPITDSTYTRALSFYKKQQDEMISTILPFLSNKEKVPFSYFSKQNEETVNIPPKEDAATTPTEASLKITEEPGPICQVEEDTVKSENAADMDMDMDIEVCLDYSVTRGKGNEEEEKLVEANCGSVLLSNVSSEAVMPELNEFESINLNRIHHLPESTH